ncbi:hypothetical protein [Dactylosporangium cerinum]
MNRAVKRVLIGLGSAALSVGVICAVWQGLISGFDLDPFLTRGPLDVWRYLLDPQHDAERALLAEASRITAWDAVIGMVAGTSRPSPWRSRSPCGAASSRRSCPSRWPCGRSHWSR